MSKCWCKHHASALLDWENKSPPNVMFTDKPTNVLRQLIHRYPSRNRFHYCNVIYYRVKYTYARFSDSCVLRTARGETTFLSKFLARRMMASDKFAVKLATFDRQMKLSLHLMLTVSIYARGREISSHIRYGRHSHKSRGLADRSMNQFLRLIAFSVMLHQATPWTK